MSIPITYLSRLQIRIVLLFRHIFAIPSTWPLVELRGTDGYNRYLRDCDRIKRGGGYGRKHQACLSKWSLSLLLWQSKQILSIVASSLSSPFEIKCSHPAQPSSSFDSLFFEYLSTVRGKKFPRKSLPLSLLYRGINPALYVSLHSSFPFYKRKKRWKFLQLNVVDRAWKTWKRNGDREMRRQLSLNSHETTRKTFESSFPFSGRNERWFVIFKAPAEFHGFSICPPCFNL